MLKKNKKKGILFWIEGFSGSGKTSISKKIYPKIKQLFGPTIIIQGDIFRKIFKLKSFSRQGRYDNSLKYRKFAKFITNQNVNLIFTVVGLMKEPRKWLRKNISNYVEIHINASLNKIRRNKKKKTYNQKKNIVGIDIKPELPLNADIVINNDFKKSTDRLSKELIIKILKLNKNLR